MRMHTLQELTLATGTGTTSNNTLTISGLAFTLSMILAFYNKTSSTNNYQSGIVNNTLISGSGNNLFCIGSGGTSTAGGTLTSGGGTLNCALASSAMYWLAIE